MARLRSNEWNFSSNAAQRITEILTADDFRQSPLGRAEAELTEFMGNRRLDLVIFDRETTTRPLITGELKVPWDALGRTPYNQRVIEDAHRKASNCGAPYFLTWNIRRVVVWRTDDPGRPLMERVVFDRELVPFAMTSAEDLTRVEFETTWRKSLEELVAFLHQLIAGPPQPAYVPLDRQFIGRLESLLDFPIEFTAQALAQRMQSDTRFRRQAESWMRDRQRWIVGPSTFNENIERASRFTCYVLVNRLCFYNALRRKYPRLDRLAIHNSIRTGDALRRRLTDAFDRAMQYTGDYDTVFELDVGDEYPFLSDAAVPEWRTLVRSLDAYDFATIPLEVIGAMYEQLISPEERHRYGQHYTQPAVVDLINAFTIRAGSANVLDPACGGGTFLVRAYARKRQLDEQQDHTALLASLYGCDLLRYAAHLSTINLAIRDLIDDENYPRIHHGDFLDVTANTVFAEQPIRIAAGGLPTEHRRLHVSPRMFDAIVGNPPYIESKEIQQNRRVAYVELARREWPGYEWDNGSDILVWFFTHSATFLRDRGYLSLLTQAAWVDGEYGIPLRHWMLDHFKIVALIETEAEPWFSDARVATIVAVLQREPDAQRRDNNPVRFVLFREPLPRPAPGEGESSRQQIAIGLRDSILAPNADTIESRFRLRIRPQGDLRREGEDGEGEYVGSRWGRYLRTIDALYALQRDRSERFCTLSTLASIARGVTTNCDDFFIVEDITQEALNRFPTASGFQSTFGVRRNDVTNGRYRIVRRDDGVELPLETTNLIPTLKTARDVNERCTSAIDNARYAVRITGERASLSRIAEAYVAAGEREHWHESQSFRGRADWYVLREADVAPILFVKTIQYTPQILWNDAGLLANQRLYNVDPRPSVDAEVLAAVLNSTIFAAERFAAVKALGREAANDVEVFTARQFKTPDIRGFTAAPQRELRDAFRRLRQREIGPLLEATLLEAGLHEARVYVDQHPVSEAVWPDELRDTDRQRIDSAILKGLGLSQEAAELARRQLYNEIVAFARKARLLELEAQINRRGRGGEGPTAAQLADDLWADLTERNEAHVMTLPNSFLTSGMETAAVRMPASGRPVIEDGNLFSGGERYALRFGREQIVPLRSAEQRDLCLLLATYRVRGEVAIPRRSSDCQDVADRIRGYLDGLAPKLRAAAAEITENTDLQDRIISEAMKRLLPHH